MHMQHPHFSIYPHKICFISILLCNKFDEVVHYCLVYQIMVAILNM